MENIDEFLKLKGKFNATDWRFREFLMKSNPHAIGYKNCFEYIKAFHTIIITANTPNDINMYNAYIANYEHIPLQERKRKENEISEYKNQTKLITSAYLESHDLMINKDNNELLSENIDKPDDDNNYNMLEFASKYLTSKYNVTTFHYHSNYVAEDGTEDDQLMYFSCTQAYVAFCAFASDLINLFLEKDLPITEIKFEDIEDSFDIINWLNHLNFDTLYFSDSLSFTYHDTQYSISTKEDAENIISIVKNAIAHCLQKTIVETTIIFDKTMHDSVKEFFNLITNPTKD